jgi:electron transfer flavoprotein alpha subunit
MDAFLNKRSPEFAKEKVQSVSRDIYVVVEQRDGNIQKVGIELIGAATRLAADLGQKVVGVLMGSGIVDKARMLVQYGANEVLVVDDPLLKEYMTEPYAKAMTHIIKTYEPEIVLFGATAIGRDLAPRVASRINTGLTADCTGLDIDPETKLLRMTRPAFGGNIMATILCENHRPQMATVRPGVMSALARDASGTGEITNVEVALDAKDLTVEILEVVKSEKTISDVTEAKYLISGGRGIGGPDGFDMLRKLAETIGPGADISSSRANVDAGWITKDRQVGQTGKTVRPNLYMACGISGAIQHLAGMEESECIIAINKNDSAPIFGVADLGIVGDVKAIVPKLIDEIARVKESKMIR